MPVLKAGGGCRDRLVPDGLRTRALRQLSDEERNQTPCTCATAGQEGLCLFECKSERGLGKDHVYF